MMHKHIIVNSCKRCPYFSPFPAEHFEGTCMHKVDDNTIDQRITNEDAIPNWCPL